MFQTNLHDRSTHPHEGDSVVCRWVMSYDFMSIEDCSLLRYMKKKKNLKSRKTNVVRITTLFFDILIILQCSTSILPFNQIVNYTAATAAASIFKLQIKSGGFQTKTGSVRLNHTLRSDFPDVFSEKLACSIFYLL